MPNIITSDSCSDAWIAAVEYILENGNGENLIIHITAPNTTTHADIDLLNPKLANGNNIHDVINTIFPFKFWERNSWKDRNSFYDTYLLLHNKSRKKRWGTYFQRLISFGNVYQNQLENIIKAIISRKTNYSSAYTLHITSCSIDNNTMIMGGPCLQYIQILPNSKSVNLVAVYRNHDYFNKALGNFVGLTRLLTFICESVGKASGSVTCHSIHYYIDNKVAVRSVVNHYKSRCYDNNKQ
ncbi:hypothetical protein [Fibrella forsythiae]|uniref:Thymidylate synthase n=1 Tax=Fibrella forsythiae TaxID=2817061 RepID=A0ABS3JST3_9BACT|nr:hypothetical protein [Fibrella forsythiae]MBO0953075.1 hypothetical protein [Fibrella forsythiae]